MYKLFGEAFVVGILVAILATIVMGIMRSAVASPTAIHYFMTTVFTGIIAHFIFEFTGLNSYYCNNGYACDKLKK